MQYFRWILLALFLTASIITKADLPDSISNQPIQTDASLAIDNVTNWKGGIQRGNAILALLDFSVTLQASQNRWLRNSMLHAHFLKSAGKGASEHFIGDMQVASNIEGRASRFVYELYLQQTLGNFQLTAGLHDLNAEFMYSDNASLFINSSFGIFPSVSLNMPVSIFPVTSFGILANYTLNDWKFLAACYNLNHDFVDESTFTLSNHFYKKGYMAVAEVNYQWQFGSNIEAQYKAGAIYKECVQPGANEELASTYPNTCYGFYFVADQDFARFSKATLTGFLQLSWTSPPETQAPFYAGAGVLLTDIRNKYLPTDLGLSFGHVDLDNQNETTLVSNYTYERVIEFTASYSIKNHFYIQPDIQYIINPSGAHNNAFVTVLRLVAELN